MTPIQTLQLATAIMFALYFVTALVGMRLFGGVQAAVWFAGSNALRAMAIALALFSAPNDRWAAAGSSVITVTGLVMLHRSFAEQLDRPKLLWRLQVSLLMIAVFGSLALSWFPRDYPVLPLLISAIVGVQAALTASALFSFSGEGVELAGRFASVGMLLYALSYLLRAVVVLHFGSPHYVHSLEQTTTVCLAGAMVSGGASTFGFTFIAAGRQRLELLWRAQIDELTGLLNRWAFKRVAVRETFRSMRKHGKLSVLMMDLDGMKRVNDKLGHSAGDAVLQGVAACLQETLRDRDSVARMGGDEFCILLPDTDLAEAVIVAERLRSQIAATEIRYRGEIIKVGASFGASCSDLCGWNWQTIMDESDAALYEAKRSGNVRVVAASKAVETAPEVSDGSEPILSGDRRRR